MRRLPPAISAVLLTLALAATVSAAPPIGGCPGGTSGFSLVPVRSDTPPGVDLNEDGMVCARLMENFPSTPFGEGPIYNWVDNVVRGR